ncbi:hypothetical protein BDM02DRAFT_3152936 [Thelephora ganbajun]|uniref:Uncharacterized protein n=1 Tax=Thelephora ganbajun TaxID=370292 RepID=A0ACB6ZWY3_THEGA|nr:hypothetical protein BDM02DRAFT_3152936 [Thelephora ganbajun]
MSDAPQTSGADDASGSRPQPAWRKRLISYLTTISHMSAPFITAFVLIHLSAPAMGAVGGGSLSSQVMLLGREYYQTPFGEKYLVLAPLVIHPFASIAKRLFSPGIGPQKSWSRLRPLTSVLSSTGYLTLFLFLPVHYLTHRIYPAIPDAPIHSFGPAELDYEFVKAGLQTWPLRSWLLYIGLVGCVALHSVEGVSIITANQNGKAIVPKSKRKLVSLLAGAPALAGLFFISRETIWALTSSVEGYMAAFSKSMIYRAL